MQKLELAIDGMGCGACVKKVQDALEGVPNVRIEHVEIGRASLICEANAADPKPAVDALAKAGFAAAPVGTKQ